MTTAFAPIGPAVAAAAHQCGFLLELEMPGHDRGALAVRMLRWGVVGWLVPPYGGHL